MRANAMSVSPTGPTPWYGHQGGTATWLVKDPHRPSPRAGAIDGGGEVPLETYARLQDPEAMAEAVLRQHGPWREHLGIMATPSISLGMASESRNRASAATSSGPGGVGGR